MRSFQHQIPEARRDAEIYVREVMMNDMMRAQPAIPAKLKFNTVKHVVKDAVDDET